MNGKPDLLDSEPDVVRCENQTDPELIFACLEGEQRAWEALVTRYKRLVYSIPYRWGLPAQDCADIFQSVWLDCFQQLPSLRNLERLRSWLIRVAVRKCYVLRQDISKDSAAAAAFTQMQSETDDEMLARIAQFDREDLLKTAIGQLSPRCREVVSHLFFREASLDYSTIAAELGVSRNSIGSARDRCLKCLREILEDLGYRI